MSNDMLRAMSNQDWHLAFLQLRALMQKYERPSARLVDGEPTYRFVRQSQYGTIAVLFNSSSEIVNRYFEIEEGKFTMAFPPMAGYDLLDFLDFLPIVISAWLIGDTELMSLLKEKMKDYRFDNYDIDIQESITNAVIEYEVIPSCMSFVDNEATKIVVYITGEE